jgi:hypothetical protein
MARQFAAASILVIGLEVASIPAHAGYRIEHVNWGNDDAREDRIYVRDGSGRALVLSRHWGRQCKRRVALSYALGGGCWLPAGESYSAWRKKQQGWLRLKP